jgi:K+-transporting ATPase ATPase A chain
VGLYAVFVLIVTACVRPLGGYIERVFAREPTALDRACRPVERVLYRLTGVDSTREMPPGEYSLYFVLFGLTGAILLYAILRLQSLLPWVFPAYQTTPLTADLSFNTAISFSTTTTWQAYAGETTMSYASQMLGLCAENFLAGAAGLAVGVAFIRGLARERADTIGNFWRDLARGLIWILVPGALIGAVLLLELGVPMNFRPYTIVTTLEGGRQVIAQGPVAALEIIKNLGTNGGGFFNANGAHPFENPTALTNLIELLAIVLIPAALTNTFGRMVRQPRQGWLLYGAMVCLFAGGLACLHAAEQQRDRRVDAAAAAPGVALTAGNMEGKETRFGIPGSTLTAVVTSNTATGPYNAMHDSLTPLDGAVPLVNMLLGEVVFGGLGTGLVGLIMAALLAVFLAGLMIGRTLSYLGKSIGPAETKLVVLYAVIGPLAVLPLTALAVIAGAGLAGLTTNTGPHGLTEIIFAYASAFANNGQNFAGLSANSPFYNVTTAIAMLMGRFGLAAPALALAGLFARQGRGALGRGILTTDSPIFGILLVASLVAMTGLSYLPALCLGPVLEHLQWFRG